MLGNLGLGNEPLERETRSHRSQPVWSSQRGRIGILSIFQSSCRNNASQNALGSILRETGSVLTFLLLFLGIPAHNPGLCSFVFYPLFQFNQLCLVGTSSSCPDLDKILMKEKPSGSVLFTEMLKVSSLREFLFLSQIDLEYFNRKCTCSFHCSVRLSC